jgi:hypothetical protein
MEHLSTMGPDTTKTSVYRVKSTFTEVLDCYISLSGVVGSDKHLSIAPLADQPGQASDCTTLESPCWDPARLVYGCRGKSPWDRCGNIAVQQLLQKCICSCNVLRVMSSSRAATCHYMYSGCSLKTFWQGGGQSHAAGKVLGEFNRGCTWETTVQTQCNHIARE